VAKLPGLINNRSRGIADHRQRTQVIECLPCSGCGDLGDALPAAQDAHHFGVDQVGGSERLRSAREPRRDVSVAGGVEQPVEDC
jgi:hypothetical protein